MILKALRSFSPATSFLISPFLFVFSGGNLWSYAIKIYFVFVDINECRGQCQNGGICKVSFVTLFDLHLFAAHHINRYNTIKSNLWHTTTLISPTEFKDERETLLKIHGVLQR